MASAFQISFTLNERQYLSTLLLNPSLISNEENYCINQSAKDLFESLKKLNSEGISFLTNTVASEALKLNKDLTEDVIINLSKIEHNSDDFKYYSRRIREDFFKHKLSSHISKEIFADTASKGDIDLDVYRELSNQINEGISIIEGQDKIVMTTSDLTEAYDEELDKRRQGIGYTSTGDSYLDSHLFNNGLLKGSLTFVFGNSGNGKSIFAENLVNKQINKQIPSLYVSLELDKIATMDRLISIRTGLSSFDLTNLQDSTNADRVDAIYQREKERLNKYKYFRFIDDPTMSLDKLFSIVEALKREWSVESIVITVDLFSMLSDFNENQRGKSTADTIQAAVDKAFRYVRTTNCPLIGVVQVKRPQSKVEASQDMDIDELKQIINKTYTPSNEMLKSSGSYEERGRVLIGVYRQKHYLTRILGKDHPMVKVEPDILKALITKQNMGGLHDLSYLFVPEQSKLYKYISDEEEEKEDA